MPKSERFIAKRITERSHDGITITKPYWGVFDTKRGIWCRYVNYEPLIWHYKDLAEHFAWLIDPSTG